MRTYIIIDLKSFYASVECVARGLDPLNANLVVADESRTDRTICLAVSPSLKSFGIPGRPRLFEVKREIHTINEARRQPAPGQKLRGKSRFLDELKADPSLAVDYFTAPPRMAKYIQVSAQIYKIYLRHVAPEDMHVYSIDEVFMDATNYLKAEGCTAREFAGKILKEVLWETGIPATAGIGPNLYLCKVALDITAKHLPEDEEGCRIAELDEISYRRTLWEHLPLTDFWRVGKGYTERLKRVGLHTMGDIARCSVGGQDDYYNEDLLYNLFGVNAELLIDHAWGWEPCTIADIKTYKPASSSISSGQVLMRPYTFEGARIVIGEMADALALELVRRGSVTDGLTVTVGYDFGSVKNGDDTRSRKGRAVPKPTHGTKRLERQTSSERTIRDAVWELYDELVDRRLTIRRLQVEALRLCPEQETQRIETEQLSMFSEPAKRKVYKEEDEREKKRQKAILSIKDKHGKNAIFKGASLQKDATARERNRQIGGHKA